jgi:hypothetical protein
MMHTLYFQMLVLMLLPSRQNDFNYSQAKFESRTVSSIFLGIFLPYIDATARFYPCRMALVISGHHSAKKATTLTTCWYTWSQNIKLSVPHDC